MELDTIFDNLLLMDLKYIGKYCNNLDPEFRKRVAVRLNALYNVFDVDRHQNSLDEPIDINNEELITVKRASELTGITPVSLYKQIKNGTLKSVKFGSKHRIRKSDLFK